MTAPRDTFLDDLFGAQGEKITDTARKAADAPQVSLTKQTVTALDADGKEYRPYDRLIALSQQTRTPEITQSMMREAQKLTKAGFPEAYRDFKLERDYEKVIKYGAGFLAGVGKALQPLAAPQQLYFGYSGGIVDLLQGQNPGEKMSRGYKAAMGFATYGLLNGEARTKAITGKELMEDLGMKGTAANVTGVLTDFFVDPLLVGAPLKYAGTLAKAGKLGKTLAGESRLAQNFQKIANMSDVVDNVAAGAVKNPAAFKRAVGEIIANPLKSTSAFPGLFDDAAKYAGTPWAVIRENIDVAAGFQSTMSTLNAVARIPFSPAPIKQAWQAIPLTSRMRMGESVGSAIEAARLVPSRLGSANSDTLTLGEAIISRWGTIPGIPEVNITALRETGKALGTGISRALQNTLRQRQIEAANVAMRALDLSGRYSRITKNMSEEDKLFFDHLTTRTLDNDDPASIMSNYLELERFAERMGMRNETDDFIRRVADYDFYGATVRRRLGLEDEYGLNQYHHGNELIRMITTGDRDAAQEIINQWTQFSVNPRFNNVMVQGHTEIIDRTGKVTGYRPEYNPVIGQNSPATLKGQAINQKLMRTTFGVEQPRAGTSVPAPTHIIPQTTYTTGNDVLKFSDNWDEALEQGRELKRTLEKYGKSQFLMMPEHLGEYPRLIAKIDLPVSDPDVAKFIKPEALENAVALPEGHAYNSLRQGASPGKPNPFMPAAFAEGGQMQPVFNESALPADFEPVRSQMLRLPDDMKTPDVSENPFPTELYDQLVSSTKVTGKSTIDYLNEIPVIPYDAVGADRFDNIVSSFDGDFKGYKKVDATNEAMVRRVQAMLYAQRTQMEEAASRMDGSFFDPEDFDGPLPPYISTEVSDGVRIANMDTPTIYLGPDNGVYVIAGENVGRVVERKGQLYYYGTQAQKRRKALPLGGEEVWPVDPGLADSMNAGSGRAYIAYGAMRNDLDAIQEGNALGAFDEDIEAAFEAKEGFSSRFNTQISAAEANAKSYEAKVNNLFDLADQGLVTDIRRIYPDELDVGAMPNNLGTYRRLPDDHDWEDTIMFHGGNAPFAMFVSDLSPLLYTKGAGNLYSHGMYNTILTEMSAGYGRSSSTGGTGAGRISAVRLKNIKAFNAEKPPKDTATVMRLARKRALNQATDAEVKKAINEYYDAVNEALKGNMPSVNPHNASAMGPTPPMEPFEVFAQLQYAPQIWREFRQRVTRENDAARALDPNAPIRELSTVGKASDWQEIVATSFTEALMDRGYNAIRHLGGIPTKSDTLHDVLIVFGNRERGLLDNMEQGPTYDAFTGKRDDVRRPGEEKTLTEANVKTVGMDRTFVDESTGWAISADKPYKGFDPTLRNQTDMLDKPTIAYDDGSGNARPLASVSKALRDPFGQQKGKLVIEGLDDLAELAKKQRGVQRHFRVALADAHARGFRSTGVLNTNALVPTHDPAGSIEAFIDSIPGATMFRRPELSTTDAYSGIRTEAFEIHLDERIYGRGNLFEPKWRKQYNTPDEGTFRDADWRALNKPEFTMNGVPSRGFVTKSGKKVAFDYDNMTASVLDDAGNWTPPRPVTFAEVGGKYSMDYLRNMTLNGSRLTLLPNGNTMVYRKSQQVPGAFEPESGYTGIYMKGDVEKGYVPILVDRVDPDATVRVYDGQAPLHDQKVTEFVFPEPLDEITEIGPDLPGVLPAKSQYGQQTSTAANPFVDESVRRDPNAWNPHERDGARLHLRRQFLASSRPEDVIRRIDAAAPAKVAFDTDRLEKVLLGALVRANKTDVTAREFAEGLQRAWAGHDNIAPVDFVGDYFAAHGLGPEQIEIVMNEIGGNFWKMGIDWRPPGEELLTQMHNYLAKGGFNGNSGSGYMMGDSRTIEKSREDLAPHWQEALNRIQDINEVIQTNARINEKSLSRRGMVQDMYAFLESNGGIIKGKEAATLKQNQRSGWRTITSEIHSALKGEKIVLGDDVLGDLPFEVGDMIPAAYYQALTGLVTEAKPTLVGNMLTYLNSKWKQRKVASPAAIVRDFGSNYALASMAGINPVQMSSALADYWRLYIESTNVGRIPLDVLNDRAFIKLPNGQKVTFNEMLESGDFLHSGFMFKEVNEPLSQLAENMLHESGGDLQKVVRHFHEFNQKVQAKVDAGGVQGAAIRAGRTAADLAGFGGPVTKFLGDTKGMVDMSFKGAIYIAKRKQGMSPAQASKYADDLFFNYENVPYIVDFLRRNGISPFAAFQFLSAGRFIKTLYENPYSIQRMYRIPGSLREVVGEDEYDKEARARPEYMRNSLWIPQINMATGEFRRDEHGRSMWTNLGAFLPETATADSVNQGPGGFMSSMTSPMFDLAATLITGQGYRGTPVYEGGVSMSEAFSKNPSAAWEAVAREMWRFGVSPWAPGSPMAEKLGKSIEEHAVPADAVAHPGAKGFMEEIAAAVGQPLVKEFADFQQDGPVVSLTKLATPGPNWDKLPTGKGQQPQQDVWFTVARYFGINHEAVTADRSIPGSARNNMSGLKARRNDLEAEYRRALRNARPEDRQAIKDYYRKESSKLKIDVGVQKQ